MRGLAYPPGIAKRQTAAVVCSAESCLLALLSTIRLVMRATPFKDLLDSGIEGSWRKWQATIHHRAHEP